MYKYNCKVCRKEFNHQLSPTEIRYRICPSCINVYMQVDREFKDSRQRLKAKELDTSINML